MLDLKNLMGIHKIYRVNVSTIYSDICFFFVYYEEFGSEYMFRNTKLFQLHWKKHLSKKQIDYLLTLEYYYWFKCNIDQVQSINFEEKICEQFILLPPIIINIQEYNV